MKGKILPKDQSRERQRTRQQKEADARKIVETFPRLNPNSVLDQGFIQQQARFFSMGDCFIILATMPDTGAWHMSISTKTRYPSWDEVVRARYELIPDGVTMAMMLPPKSQYINVHEFCFQLHQVDSPGRPDDNRRYIIPGLPPLGQTPTALREDPAPWPEK